MSDQPDYQALAEQIRVFAQDLGFQQLGISAPDIGEHEQWLHRWLDAGYQGEMEWMASHGSKRTRPPELVPGTQRVISVRMDYLPADAAMARRLASPDTAYISRYALGRDYHKLIRRRLQQLAERIERAEEWFEYHMLNYERAEEVGSAQSAERSLSAAATWAAILTALRAQEAHNG